MCRVVDHALTWGCLKNVGQDNRRFRKIWVHSEPRILGASTLGNVLVGLTTMPEAPSVGECGWLLFFSVFWFSLRGLR